MNMALNNKKLLWIPRALAIVFILFLSLFALDVFSMQAPVLEKIIGFIMHLIPSFVLLAVLIIAWKYPAAGGLVLILLSIVFTVFFRTYQDIITFFIISFPLVIIGVLFIVFSFMSKKTPHGN